MTRTALIELARFGSRLSDHLRAVIVASPDADGPELPGFALYHDAKRQFCFAYGRQAGGFPDPARRLYLIDCHVHLTAQLDQGYRLRTVEDSDPKVAYNAAVT